MTKSCVAPSILELLRQIFKHDKLRIIQAILANFKIYLSGIWLHVKLVEHVHNSNIQ